MPAPACRYSKPALTIGKPGRRFNGRRHRACGLTARRAATRARGSRCFRLNGRPAIIIRHMESSLTSVLVKLALVLLLVLANGFFVAAEYALVSVRRSRIDSLAAQGSKRAQMVMRVLEKQIGRASCRERV